MFLEKENLHHLIFFFTSCKTKLIEKFIIVKINEMSSHLYKKYKYFIFN